MLIIVAALLIILCLFHSILGEKIILQRVKRVEDLPKIWGSQTATFRTIQVTWHLVSALWFGLALYLVAMTVYPDYLAVSFLLIFGVIFAGLTALPFIFASGKHKSWIAFGLIAAILLYQAYEHWAAL